MTCSSVARCRWRLRKRLLGSGTAEAAGAAAGLGKLVDLLPLHALVLSKHQLGHALPFFHDEALP